MSSRVNDHSGRVVNAENDVCTLDRGIRIII